MRPSTPSELLSRLVVEPGVEQAWTDFVESLDLGTLPDVAHVLASARVLCEQAEALGALRLLMAVGARSAGAACDEIYALAHSVALRECLDTGLAKEVREVWTSKRGEDALPAAVRAEGSQSRWEAKVADAVRQAGMTRDPSVRAELYGEAAYCVYTAGMSGLRGEARAALLRQATSWLEESSRQAPFHPRSARLWERVLLEEERVAELMVWLRERAARADDSAEAVRALFVLARLHKESTRNLAGALDAYRAVLALRPAFAPALHALAELYSKAKAWDELAQLYQSQVDATPAASEARLDLARRLARLAAEHRSAPDEAARWFEVIRAVDPTNAEALEYLRRHFSERKQWGRLRRVVEEALLLLQGSQDPRVPALQQELPQLLEASAIEEEEVRSARASWRAGQGNAAARDVLLATYERAGRDQEALDVLQRECEVADDADPATIVVLAQLHRALKERGLYGADLRRVLERRRRLEPGNSLVLRELVAQYDASGRDEDAAAVEEDLGAAARTPEQSSDYLRQAAERRFQKLGDTRGAIQCLLKGLRASPGDLRARGLLLRYAAEPGRSGEAIAWLRERLGARAEGLDGSEDRGDLVHLLWNAGQPQQALAEVREGLAELAGDVSLALRGRDIAERMVDLDLYEEFAAYAYSHAQSATLKHEVALQSARACARTFGRPGAAVAWYRKALASAATRADVLTELCAVPPAPEDWSRIAEDLQELGDPGLAESVLARSRTRLSGAELRAVASSTTTLRPGVSALPPASLLPAVPLRPSTVGLSPGSLSEPALQAQALDGDIRSLKELPGPGRAAQLLARIVHWPSVARALAMVDAEGAGELLLAHATIDDLLSLVANLSSGDEESASRWLERAIHQRPSEVAWGPSVDALLTRASEASRYRRVLRLLVDAAEQAHVKKALLMRWVEVEESRFEAPREATERSKELAESFPDDADLSVRYGLRATRSGEHRLALDALLRARPEEGATDLKLLLRIAEVARCAGDDVLAFATLCEARDAGAESVVWLPMMEAMARIEAVRDDVAASLLAAYEHEGRWLDAARVQVEIAEAESDAERRVLTLSAAMHNAKRGGDGEQAFSLSLRIALATPGSSEGWWNALVDATSPGRCSALAAALDAARYSESLPPLQSELEWDFREALVTRAMSESGVDAPWIDGGLRRMLELRPHSEWAQEVLLSRLAARRAWSEWVDARVEFARVAETEEERLNHIEQAARVCLDNLSDATQAVAVLDMAEASTRADLALYSVREDAFQKLGDTVALHALYTRMLEAPEPAISRDACAKLVFTRADRLSGASERIHWLERMLKDAPEASCDEAFASEMLADPDTDVQSATLIANADCALSDGVRAYALEICAREAPREETRIEALQRAWGLRQKQATMDMAALGSLAQLIRVAPQLAEPYDKVLQYFGQAGQLEMLARAMAHGAQRSGQLEHADRAASLYVDALESPAEARRVWEAYCDADHISEILRAQARERWAALAERTGRASDVDALLARTLDGGHPLPASGDLLERLARLRADRIGDKAGAARVWRLVLESDPNNPRALAEVQEILEAEGDDTALADVLARRIRTLPARERERAYAQLLKVLSRTQQDERAVAQFLQAADDGMRLDGLDEVALACALRLDGAAPLAAVVERCADDERIPLQRRVDALESLARRTLSSDHEQALGAVRRALHLAPSALGARALLVDLMGYPDIAGEASATLLPFVQASGDVRAVRATLDTFLLHSHDLRGGVDEKLETAFHAAEATASGAGLPYAARGLEASLSNPDRAQVWSMRIAARAGAEESLAMDHKLERWLSDMPSNEVASTLSRLGLELAHHLPEPEGRVIRHLSELCQRGAATSEERESLANMAARAKDVGALHHAYLAARRAGSAAQASAFGLRWLQLLAEADLHDALRRVRDVLDDVSPSEALQAVRALCIERGLLSEFSGLLLDVALLPGHDCRDDWELEAADLLQRAHDPSAMDVVRGVLSRGSASAKARILLKRWDEPEAWVMLAEDDEDNARFEDAFSAWSRASEMEVVRDEKLRFAREAERAAGIADLAPERMQGVWCTVLENAPGDADASEQLRALGPRVSQGVLQRLLSVSSGVALEDTERDALRALAAALTTHHDPALAAERYKELLRTCAAADDSLLAEARALATQLGDRDLELEVLGHQLSSSFDDHAQTALAWTRARAAQGARLEQVRGRLESVVAKGASNELLDALLDLPTADDAMSAPWVLALLDMRLAGAPLPWGPDVLAWCTRATQLASEVLKDDVACVQWTARACSLGAAAPWSMHARHLALLLSLGQQDAAAMHAQAMACTPGLQPDANLGSGDWDAVWTSWRRMSGAEDAAAEWAWTHASTPEQRLAVAVSAYESAGLPLWGQRLLGERLVAGSPDEVRTLAGAVQVLPQHALLLARFSLVDGHAESALAALRDRHDLASLAEVQRLEAWALCLLQPCESTFDAWITALEDAVASPEVAVEVGAMCTLLNAAEFPPEVRLRASAFLHRRAPEDADRALAYARALAASGRSAEALALVLPLLATEANAPLIAWALTLADHAADVNAWQRLRRAQLERDEASDARAWAEFASELKQRHAAASDVASAWRGALQCGGATVAHAVECVDAYAALGDCTEATKAAAEFERSTKLRPKELAPLKRQLAACLEQAGRQLEARELYDGAFRAEPTHVPTLWRLAELNTDLGRWDEAKRFYRALLLQKWSPESGRAREDIYAELEKIEAELKATGK